MMVSLISGFYIYKTLPVAVYGLSAAAVPGTLFLLKKTILVYKVNKNFQYIIEVFFPAWI